MYSFFEYEYTIKDPFSHSFSIHTSLALVPFFFSLKRKQHFSLTHAYSEVRTETTFLFSHLHKEPNNFLLPAKFFFRLSEQQHISHLSSRSAQTSNIGTNWSFLLTCDSWIFFLLVIYDFFYKYLMISVLSLRIWFVNKPKVGKMAYPRPRYVIRKITCLNESMGETN